MQTGPLTHLACLTQLAEARLAEMYKLAQPPGSLLPG